MAIFIKSISYRKDGHDDLIDVDFVGQTMDEICSQVTDLLTQMALTKEAAETAIEAQTENTSGKMRLAWVSDETAPETPEKPGKDSPEKEGKK